MLNCCVSGRRFSTDQIIPPVGFGSLLLWWFFGAGGERVGVFFKHVFTLVFSIRKHISSCLPKHFVLELQPVAAGVS